MLKSPSFAKEVPAPTVGNLVAALKHSVEACIHILTVTCSMCKRGTLSSPEVVYI